MSYRRRYYGDDDDYDYDYKWQIDMKAVKRDFLNYANKEKIIDADGYEKMGKTLGIDIYKDTFLTYFIYKCNADKLESITEDQYIEGMKAFKCNTLNELKNKIISIKEELLEIGNENFRNFYYFLFDINFTSKGKTDKVLTLDYVEVYFKGLFYDQFPIVKEFIEYLKTKDKKDKNEKEVGLKWDEWRTFLDFLINQATTFPKDYNVADYYPTLIDDFYYWYCQKHNIPIPKDEEED